MVIYIYIYIYVYIYVIMKTLCPAGYCHNGFVATLAHGHIDYMYNSVYVYIIYNIYVNIYIYII